MITDEIFLIQDNKTETKIHCHSRRELAKKILAGYATKPMIIVRFERNPGKTANYDIGPELYKFAEDFPNFAMASVEDKREMTDILHAKIDEILR